MPISKFLLKKKTKLSVGGTFKDDSIIIQGDYRDNYEILKLKGFKVKRGRLIKEFQLSVLVFTQK
jgi:translation initiation factor 1 (eIF-1/SUI1)